ncbi:hypothetical protein [Mycobacterium lepromatosis]|uniref:hypothetical protein n=1 Tax=Mycobacterium lepromatosis TaxID=480418 RepID=UPI0005F7BD72|nr:hypothetical protein [Mycobacterium lepromatosis]
MSVLRYVLGLIFSDHLDDDPAEFFEIAKPVLVAGVLTGGWCDGGSPSILDNHLALFPAHVNQRQSVASLTAQVFAWGNGQIGLDEQ